MININISEQEAINILFERIRELENKIGVNTNGNKFSPNSVCREGVELNKEFGGKYTIKEIIGMVEQGNFDDIYVGDTITVDIGIEKVELIVAGVNLNIQMTNEYGGTEFKNHIALLPKDCFKDEAVMNETPTTEGGYYNTKMCEEILPKYTKAFERVFGESHLLSPYNYMCDEVKNGKEFGYMFNDSDNSDLFKLQLLTEIEVCGRNIWNTRTEKHYD